MAVQFTGMEVKAETCSCMMDTWLGRWVSSLSGFAVGLVLL